MGREHRFYNADDISIEDVAGEELILPGKNTFTRKVLEDENKKTGF